MQLKRKISCLYQTDKGIVDSNSLQCQPDFFLTKICTKKIWGGTGLQSTISTTRHCKQMQQLSSCQRQNFEQVLQEVIVLFIQQQSDGRGVPGFPILPPVAVEAPPRFQFGSFVSLHHGFLKVLYNRGSLRRPIRLFGGRRSSVLLGHCARGRACVVVSPLS